MLSILTKKEGEAMNNRDRLNAMTNEELAKYLCYLMEIIADLADMPCKDLCDICPARKRCKKGHNGILDWLNSDSKEDFIINDLPYL